MMELVPTIVDGAVLFSINMGCRANCADCGDLSVSMHNLLLASKLDYVIIDLQDEKHICDSFIEEILQLWKRLQIPFLFAGVMPGVEIILKRHSYYNHFEAFNFGEEAITDLKKKQPNLFGRNFENIDYGKVMLTPKSKAAAAGEAAEADDEKDD
jgi:hypothetical protein